MKCPYCIKVCTKCNRILIAYEGNFKKEKKGKWGLSSRCKECCKKYDEQYYKDNKEHFKEYRKQYYKENKEHCDKKSREYYGKNKEQYKEYYEENKEKIKEYKKQHYENNKKYYKESYKKYREDNKEYLKEYNQQWRENNPDKVSNYHNNRRTKEENQGDGISKEQWYEMMNFFDWKCAYSGEYLGGDSKLRTIDHIIPLAKGGLNEIWNCVPMYKLYNSSKYTKNMEEWYIQQFFFNEERLIKIYEWQEYAWNKWNEK